MLEFQHPIPVVVEGDKNGYAIYVTNSGTFENDVWCVTLCDGGHVRHYTSDQVKIYANATFEIKKPDIMTDEIVEQVVQKFKQRSSVGISKYGTTLYDNNHDNYLLHLQQELQDATLYIEKLITQNAEITNLVNTIPDNESLGAKIRSLVS